MKKIIMVIVLALMLSSCSPASKSAAPMESPANSAPAGAFQGENADGADFNTTAQTADSPVVTANRIVIRNASLTIVVKDPAQAMGVVSRMAETMGGFVVSSEHYKTYTSNGVEVPEATLTVRVPAERLNEAMEQIKALVDNPARDIRSENVTGQDVTKDYTDLNSRLKNLEETEARLREIMASAKKTEDVLAVNDQLTRIREQIEVIKGQIKYYDEAAALSAISVQIKAQASVQPLEIGGWQPEGVARNALQALINTMQFLASATIWLILFALPVGLLIFLPFWFLWWLFYLRGKKNRRKNASAANPPPPPAPSA